MLSVAEERLAAHKPDVMYGQELNPESYALCKADMLIKGEEIANIHFGTTLSSDGRAPLALVFIALVFIKAIPA